MICPLLKPFADLPGSMLANDSKVTNITVVNRNDGILTPLNPNTILIPAQ